MFIPRNRLFWAVSIAHFANDVFLSMGPLTIAFIAATFLPMSNTEMGLMISAAQLIGATSQPIAGYVADRTGGRWMGSLGVLWVTIMFALALFVAQATQNYWLMFVPFALRTLGSGAYHPVGSMHAADSDKEHTAGNMAIFFLLGQFGLAVGPALTGFLLDQANPILLDTYTDMLNLNIILWQPANVMPLYIVLLSVIPSVLFMLVVVPGRDTYQKNKNEEHARYIAENGEDSTPKTPFPIKAFLILGAIVLLRALGQPGSVNFLPVLFREKGWSPAEYGMITSLFWVASGTSGLIMGQLADRFNPRVIVTGSLLLGAPAFYLLPVTDGAAAFILALAAGGMTGGSHSIIVVLAQNLVPSSKGFASGAALGFIFGSGALGSLIIGRVSDIIGLGTTFQWVALSIALAGVMALILPAKRKSA